jgi:MoxR-like ATPase
MQECDMTIEQASRQIENIKNEVKKVIVGQDDVIDQVLAALVAGGHVLVEGLPGLGKTLLVRVLAASFGGKSNRVQFTPDLMPSDIIGHVLYDVQSGKFTTRKGPVFTHILIADEINRAPAKTQAALLEVMQEFQVSFDGQIHPLERPFMTLATQNPAEHEGTYPLPDAQLDRFLLKIRIPYPSMESESKFVNDLLNNKTGETFDLSMVRAVCDIPALVGIQMLCAEIRVDRAIIDYAVRMVERTRNHYSLRVGASPRASLALIRLARASALAEGRDFTDPDDVLRWALPVLRHRVIPSSEWEIDGRGSEEAIELILSGLEAPRE